ncbi:glycosyltransferase [Devosia sp. PTR5]|uniref:Glycosyltransferase n=1 Tax=Devosia oryzisoli TaxID=2774138 RepID=A0A927FYJ8_9HYPH|nr:cellulose synthase catalytic subunit [Devosia oryzisoli]MBD8067168.1 glycosyltransferase [Devosia oryzisoli]
MVLFPDWLVAWMPSLLVIGIGLGIAPLLPRSNGWMRLAMMLVAGFFSLRYLTWRVTETIAPPGFTLDAFVSWSFAFIEAMTIVSSISAFLVLSRHRSRSADADANLPWVETAQPSVAILVATYNEEWPVLERTLAGAMASQYANKTIHVLDDGRRDWLRDRCAALGVEHVTRPDNAHGKAGNINHFLRQLRERGREVDFVAVLDADFVPHQDFLTRTLALFADSKIGLVQTPQHFFNPDPIQHNLGISRSYPDEQRFFFDHMQPARDGWDIAVCCGTSSIVRWTALDAIGDFPTASVTEDYMLTSVLKMKGYSTAYLNEPLSEGLAPEGLKEYITQRSRWCLGLMQIVRSSAGPFSREPLRLRDRWSVLDSCLYWLTTFPFKIACIVYPLLYWYFGVTVVDARLYDVISYFGPYYLATMMFLNFVSVGMFVPIVNDISQLVGAWEISRSALTGLVKPHGHAFKVTMKGGDRDRIVIQWPIMRRFLAAFVLTVVGLLIGLTSDYLFDAHAGEGKAVILFWTLYNLLVLAGTMLVCVELPRTASILRSRPEQVEVVVDGRRRMAWLTDIHAEALRLRGLSLPLGTRFICRIPEVGEVEAEVTLSLDASLDASIALTPAQREDLIEKLHTRSGVPGTAAVAAAGLGAGLLRRIIAGTVR